MLPLSALLNFNSILNNIIDRMHMFEYKVDNNMETAVGQTW